MKLNGSFGLTNSLILFCSWAQRVLDGPMLGHTVRTTNHEPPLTYSSSSVAREAIEERAAAALECEKARAQARTQCANVRAEATREALVRKDSKWSKVLPLIPCY